MNKVIFVKAHFKSIYGDVQVEVPTGEMKKDIFGRVKEVTRTEKRRQVVGQSDSQIDGERLSNDLTAAVEALNNAGFEVVNISPVTSGAYTYQYSSQGITSKQRVFGDTEKVEGGGSYGYGYGYSYTEGMTILARKSAS